jgi:hypothetical protein
MENFPFLISHFPFFIEERARRDAFFQLCVSISSLKRVVFAPGERWLKNSAKRAESPSTEVLLNLHTPLSPVTKS